MHDAGKACSVEPMPNCKLLAGLEVDLLRMGRKRGVLHDDQVLAGAHRNLSHRRADAVALAVHEHLAPWNDREPQRRRCRRGGRLGRALDRAGLPRGGSAIGAGCSAAAPSFGFALGAGCARVRARRRVLAGLRAWERSAPLGAPRAPVRAAVPAATCGRRLRFRGLPLHAHRDTGGEDDRNAQRQEHQQPPVGPPDPWLPQRPRAGRSRRRSGDAELRDAGRFRVACAGRPDGVDLVLTHVLVGARAFVLEQLGELRRQARDDLVIGARDQDLARLRQSSSRAARR